MDLWWVLCVVVVLKRWLLSCEEEDKKDEGEMIWKIEDPSVDVLCHARPLCERERKRESWSDRQTECVCVLGDSGN